MKKLAMALFGVFAFSVSAQAAVFDFVAEAAGNEGGATSIVFGPDADGHIVTATGYDWGTHATYAAAGTDVYNAYLDDVSGGPGGLGVCKELDGSSQCKTPSDDNVTDDEALRFELSGGATYITDLTFNDADHVAILGTPKELLTVHYRIGEGAGVWIPTDFVTLSTLVLAGSVIEIAVDSDASQFYVSTLSTVPVPAAVWLFGTAMLGLFGMRRKAKMGAVAA